MSRTGKKPILIPEGTNVLYQDHVITVKGNKGELSRQIHPRVDILFEKNEARIKPLDSSNQARALHGLTRSLVNNMVVGVTKGFERTLEINGVGYRVDIKGDTLTLTLGYSHPILFKLPEGVKATVEKQTVVTLSGIDRELLGVVAAKIRGFRSVEPYKGKGIRYSGERVRRKAGKTGAK
ncbi:MAG: 50S ribosomal protein L6 [Pseudomonadota bacterium]